MDRTRKIFSLQSLTLNFLIRWVHDNIASFSGAADRITVFGQSAGGMSTSLHLINDESAKMINNVIIESSPFAIPLKEKWEAKKQFAEFESVANCTHKEMNEKI